MTDLRKYRMLHHELRGVEGRLSELAEEAKAHPDKPWPGQTPKPEWYPIARDFTRRREALKRQRNTLADRLHELQMQMNQQPLSKASLADVIDQLVAIEAVGDEESPEAALDKLGTFIDHLEEEEERLENLEAGRAKTA